MTVFTNLTGSGVSSATSATTASISPIANRLILVTVHAYINAGSVQPATPTVTGNGITYALERAQDTDDAGADRGTLFVFRGMATSPTPGAITISFGAVTMTRIQWAVDQSDANVSTLGSNGSGAVIQSTGVTLAAAATSGTVNYVSAMRSSSSGYAAWGHQTQEAKVQRSGWTEVSDVFTVSLASVETQYIASPDTAGSASWTTSSRAGGIILEIATAPSPLVAWNFDEASGDALDISGNGRALTLASNNWSRVAGKNGSGIQQITTSGTVGPSITPFLTASRTTMFDAKLVSPTGNWWVMEYYRSTAMAAPNDTGVWGLLYLSGVLRWRVKNAANVVTEITIDADPGNWHNICATISGTTLKLYRDGTLLSSATVSGGAWTSADTLKMIDTAGTSVVIDNVRAYDFELDAASIASLAGTPVTSGVTTGPNVYFSGGAQASGIYEMTSGGLIQRNNLITIK
jgi:hypothetical protein